MPRTILTFDQTGILTGIREDVPDMDSFQGVEFYSGVIVPGLVNCHTHSELSAMHGSVSRGTGLTGFVKEIGNARVKFSAEEAIGAVSYHDSKMYSEGVAAVADICNFDVSFSAKKSGIHYHNFIELFGFSDDWPSAVMRGNEIVKVSHDNNMKANLTPHSTYSVPDGMFKSIISANIDNGLLSIHFMESRDEKELYSNEGRLAVRYKEIGYDPDFLHYGSPAKRLIGSIPPEIPLLLIHNTFVSAEEIDIIESHFKDVTWVLCPRSNLFIERALPDVKQFRDRGCRIAIGTDSLASNDSLSMADEISFMLDNLDVSFAEAIDWATINGAEALQIDHWAGSFEIGKKPGAVITPNFDCKSFRRIL